MQIRVITRDKYNAGAQTKPCKKRKKKKEGLMHTLVQGEKQPDQQRECKETSYHLKKTSPNKEAENNIR